MVKAIFYSVILLSLVGCQQTKREERGPLSEEATVIGVYYQPSMHSSNISPGMNFNGDINFNLVTIDVPEKYTIVFKCQHGTFMVEGKQRFDKFAEFIGKKVTVVYFEVFRNTYDKDELVKSVLIDYDFIDANPIDKSNGN